MKFDVFRISISSFFSSGREKNSWDANLAPSMSSSGMPWFLTVFGVSRDKDHGKKYLLYRKPTLVHASRIVLARALRRTGSELEISVRSLVADRIEELSIHAFLARDKD